ncbi:MAG: Crp/Fnr family transcriptional regulator [Clostridia bacterium]|nr:Crp/Fnr family transcriptional regulator [Clostridia bacterium]
MKKSTLLTSPLFSGMSELEIERALKIFDAVEKQYAKNEIIAQTGTKLTRFGIVLEGTVQVNFIDIDGNLVLMASVTAGDAFAESLCWLKVQEIPVTITAFSDARVLWLDPSVLSSNCDDALVTMLRNRFISILAAKTLAMNDRVQVLSKPTLRQKIITFLSQYSNRFSSKTFSVPFDRESLALYLGVNRSALSRELSAMKNEGIIDFYKNTFKILK